MAVTISRHSSYCPNFATAPISLCCAYELSEYVGIARQWREVADQWTAVDAEVGVVCSSFDSVGAR